MFGRRGRSSNAASVSTGRELVQKIAQSISKNDHAQAMENLDDFKVHAATTFGGDDIDFATRCEELKLAREAAEHGVMISALSRDESGFERHASQVRAAYDACKRASAGVDAKHAPIEASANEPLIVGLNLLRLLVQNRIAEFHTELETTDREVLNDARVQAVLELEQFLMEGAYNKIAQRQGALPDPSYEYFMSMLMDTVRDEIASCAESAYAKLSGDEAKKLLGFKNVKELITYAEDRGWAVDSKGAVVFNEDVHPATSKDIPSMRLINQTLLYAKELERIV